MNKYLALLFDLQCGPATGQCVPSLKAFRALLKLLWQWLPHETEMVLLRPQIQHPAQPPKELRSTATAADVRAFQDAARARLAEIRVSPVTRHFYRNSSRKLTAKN